jgi:hypothetical protein
VKHKFDEFKQHISEFEVIYDKLDEKLKQLYDYVMKNPNATVTDASRYFYNDAKHTTVIQRWVNKAFKILEHSKESTEEVAMKETFKTLFLEKTSYRPVLELLAQEFSEDILASKYISKTAIAIAFQSADMNMNDIMKLLKIMRENRKEFEEWVIQRLATLLEAKKNAQEILKLQEELSNVKARAYNIYKTMLIHAHKRAEAEMRFNELADAIVDVIKSALMLLPDSDCVGRIAVLLNMKLKEIENKEIETPALKELRRLDAIEKKVEEEYMKGKEIPIEKKEESKEKSKSFLRDFS